MKRETTIQWSFASPTKFYLFPSFLLVGFLDMLSFLGDNLFLVSTGVFVLLTTSGHKYFLCEINLACLILFQKVVLFFFPRISEGLLFRLVVYFESIFSRACILAFLNFLSAFWLICSLLFWNF